MDDIRKAIRDYSSDPRAILSKQQWITFCSHEFDIDPRESERIFILLDVDGDGFVPISDILSNISDPQDGLISSVNNHSTNSTRLPQNNILQHRGEPSFVVDLEKFPSIPRNGLGHYMALRKAISQRDEHLLVHLEKVMFEYSITLKQLESENQQLQDLCVREKLTNQEQREALAEEFEVQLQQIQRTHRNLEFERSIQRYEERIREQEQEKEMLRQKMEKMQKNLQELKQMVEANKETKRSQTTMDQVNHLSNENRSLQESLQAAQTELALTRSKLAAAKDVALGKDQTFLSEKKHYEQSIEEMEQKLTLLIEANRELSDNNDSLWDTFHRASPTLSVPKPDWRPNSISLPLAFEMKSAMFGSLPRNIGRNYYSRSQGDTYSEGPYMDRHGSDKHWFYPPSKHSSRERLFLHSVSTEASSELEMQFSARIITEVDGDSLEEDPRTSSNSIHIRNSSKSSHQEAASVDQLVQFTSDKSVDHITDSTDGIKKEVPIKRELACQTPSTLLKEETKKCRSPKTSVSSDTSIISVDEDLLETVQKHYRVILLGDPAVGKSSFVIRVCRGTFPPANTTIGIDFHRKVLYYRDMAYVMELWDTAGQERYQCITPSYMRRVDGVIIMYDCTRPSTLDGAKMWMSKVQSMCNEPVPVLLLANKTDLRRLYIGSGKTLVTTAAGRAVAKEWDMMFREISAKTEEAIDDALTDLMEKLTISLAVKPKNESLLLSRRNKAQLMFKCCHM